MLCIVSPMLCIASLPPVSAISFHPLYNPSPLSLSSSGFAARTTDFHSSSCLPPFSLPPSLSSLSIIAHEDREISYRNLILAMWCCCPGRTEFVKVFFLPRSLSSPFPPPFLSFLPSFLLSTLLVLIAKARPNISFSALAWGPRLLKLIPLSLRPSLPLLIGIQRSRRHPPLHAAV